MNKNARSLRIPLKLNKRVRPDSTATKKFEFYFWWYLTSAAFLVRILLTFWIIWYSSTLLIRKVKRGSLIIFFYYFDYVKIWINIYQGKCNLHLNTYSDDPLFGSLQLSRYLSTIGNCDCQPSIAQWKWESILDISWYTARKRKNKTTY